MWGVGSRRAESWVGSLPLRLPKLDYVADILLVATRRVHSPVQDPPAWPEPDGLAARAGSGDLFVAGAARRDPGGHGLGEPASV